MLRRSVAIVFAIVFLLTVLVVVQAAPFAAPPSPGTGESFGSVQNTGSVTTNAVIVYYDTSGTAVATKNITITPKATQGLAPRLLDGTPQQLPSGFSGSAVVSADQDVVAVSFVNWSGAASAFGGDSKTSADFGGVNVPATALYFPSVSNADTEATEISIQNADSADAIVYLNYYDRNGVNVVAARTTSAAIKSGAQATFKLTANTNLPAGFLGSIYVTSTKQLAGIAISHIPPGSFGYNGEAAGTTYLNFPKINRRSNKFAASETDCTTSAAGGWYQYSGVVAQNLSDSAAADVRVSFFDRAGTLVTAFDDTIPALSSHGYNTRFNGQAPAANINALGCDFLGSVVITSTGTPIVGVEKEVYLTDKFASGYNGVPSTAGGQSMYFPFFYHNDASQSSSTGQPTNWTAWTGLIVQNVDAAPVDVYLNVLGRDGSTVIASLKDPTSIGIGSSHGYNARFGGAFPASTFNVLPLNFNGGAYITATGKIVGLMSTTSLYGGDVNETLGFAR
jgi:hypothetical protein